MFVIRLLGYCCLAFLVGALLAVVDGVGGDLGALLGTLYGGVAGIAVLPLIFGDRR